LPEIPGASASEERLSGGYPSVHPVLEPSERDPNRSAGTPSGAHEPGGRDSHPFGEPRFDGGAFGDVPPSANAAVPLPGTESVAEPDFYFLHGADSAKGSAARSTSRPGSGSGAALSVFDVENVRRDFPALHQRINGRPLVWLDNAATTHKPQSVIDATSRFYGRDNSNIHRAAHTLAARSTELFEAGREKVRQFLGASDAKEIIFVRGTTEAINLVAQSYGRQNVGAGDEIIVSEMEHHANIVPWQLLAQQVGAVIRVAPMNDRG